MQLTNFYRPGRTLNDKTKDVAIQMMVSICMLSFKKGTSKSFPASTPKSSDDGLRRKCSIRMDQKTLQ
ncbi:MAG TPA: hypothetical protein VFW07_22090 [Parafilimonas sp.]|nr:hypothetical protein [Parafilimonas sp.]